MLINCVAYEAGRRRAEVDLAEACPAEQDGSFIWVGLHEPNKELLRTVQQRFGLHDLLLAVTCCLQLKHRGISATLGNESLMRTFFNHPA